MVRKLLIASCLATLPLSLVMVPAAAQGVTDDRELATPARFKPVYANFTIGYQYQPSLLGLGASQAVEDVTWTNWNQPVATGTGTYPYNDCVPDCAAGTITRSPVTLTVSGFKNHCGKKHRTRVYRTLFIHFVNSDHPDPPGIRTFC